MSLRVGRLLNQAGDAAFLGKEKNSNMIFTHGAIIAKGKKKICCGYNHKRSYVKGKLYCSLHAEMDAILTWISIFGKGKDDRTLQKIAKKFDIYIVRINKSCNHYVGSEPCSRCCEAIKNIGFKNIYYSNDSGGFIKKKGKDLNTEHESDAQENLSQFISFKHNPYGKIPHS